MSIENLIDRLAELRKDTSPDSAKVKTALMRIGSVLQAQMTKNAPIKTGNLRQRIQYIIRKVGNGAELQVGSFATPYAAMIEFGYNGIQQVRAHGVKPHQRTLYARSSLQTRRTFGKSTQQVSAHQVRAHGRRVNRAARPFIRPAIEEHAQFIVDMIRTIAEP